MKEIRWIGGCKGRLKDFPDEAMDEAGHQLRQMQKGLEPIDWKPLKSIDPEVLEIRLHRPREFRVVCVAKYPEAIYVLHAFGKTTEKTPLKDIQIARTAYAKVQRQRAKH